MSTGVFTLELYTFLVFAVFSSFVFILCNLARCASFAVSSASSCRQQPAARAFKELPIDALKTKYEKKRITKGKDFLCMRIGAIQFNFYQRNLAIMTKNNIVFGLRVITSIWEVFSSESLWIQTGTKLETRDSAILPSLKTDWGDVDFHLRVSSSSRWFIYRPRHWQEKNVNDKRHD